MKNQKLKFIIGLVVIALLLFSVIFTRVRKNKFHSNNRDNIVIDTDSKEYSQEELDALNEPIGGIAPLEDTSSDTDAVTGELNQEEVDKAIKELKEDNEVVKPDKTTETTTEATTEATTESSSEDDGGEGLAANEDKASQVPVAKPESESEKYWQSFVDSVSTDMFEEVVFSEAIVSDVIKGNLLGNIYGCPFTTSDFRNIYKNGFFANVTDCEISELDYGATSCVAKITFADGSTKNYSVHFELDEFGTHISDLVCTEQ